MLVVGGTSGIGNAIARAFIAEGALVTITGVTEDEVRAAAAATPGTEAVRLDVRDGDAVKASVAGLGSLDHVIYAAGIIRRGQEHDPEIFEAVLDVNLNGAMRVAAASRPLLKPGSGTILNIASMLSFFGGGMVPGYAASKGGIAQLTKSLAIAYAPDGIRVNAIAPGWIATPLTEALRSDPVRSSAILGRTPLGRWGLPEDMAGSALFLASPLAAFITGVILPVDGGYLAS
ncbi:SDR family oxidoreductase [Mesorhizobium sp. DCY119]|uniref:SDR family NAD(P)-dependent oxidoreductase n=1 Tax=Mesorhizobium sp. DCY119 TaxID=2108445 RepID=UPI0032AEA960